MANPRPMSPESMPIQEDQVGLGCILHLQLRGSRRDQGFQQGIRQFGWLWAQCSVVHPGLSQLGQSRRATSFIVVCPRRKALHMLMVASTVLDAFRLVLPDSGKVELQNIGFGSSLRLARIRKLRSLRIFVSHFLSRGWQLSGTLHSAFAATRPLWAQLLIGPWCEQAQVRDHVAERRLDLNMCVVEASY